MLRSNSDYLCSEIEDVNGRVGDDERVDLQVGEELLLEDLVQADHKTSDSPEKKEHLDRNPETNRIKPWLSHPNFRDVVRLVHVLTTR